jgi:triphosphoribosyl-dephospho-CoA synthase
LYKIFKIAEKYDRICSEWVNNYTITFDFAYPSLMTQLRKKDLGYAIVYTFLCVLAEYPDTLIARKTNSEKAEHVSRLAKEILRSGFETQSSKARLEEFDAELRRSSNLMNPGTTADMIAAALALSLLSGYRP